MGSSERSESKEPGFVGLGGTGASGGAMSSRNADSADRRGECGEESIAMVEQNSMIKKEPGDVEANTALSDDEDDDAITSVDNSAKGCRCRNETVCLPCLRVRGCLGEVWGKCGERIKIALRYAVSLSVLIYVVVALTLHGGRSAGQDTATLLLLAAIVLGTCAVHVHSRYSGARAVSGKWAECCCQLLQRWYKRHSAVLNICMVVLIILAVIVYLVVDVIVRRPASLVSLAGIAVFLTGMYLASHRPVQVVWRPVAWGLILQFVFALLVLRTSGGRATFNWLAERMTDYMSFTDYGAMFAFGENFRDHFFVFRVMPTIIFFSATISILYHLGALQVLIRVIAKVMNVTMATGGLETFHAAVNIFCGWAESIMVIRPFLDTMTLSELHAVMTNGFSTVAGSAIAAYVLYGVSAKHLISASCMSAPAALAMSKLFYPSRSRDLHKVDIKHVPSESKSIVDAASQGAVAAIGVVAHIVATVVAFISLLAFLNASLQWMGERVGLAPPLYPPLTFQFLCSYLLWPLAYLLGVPAQDCRVVARLLGVKIFINEFIAYQDLGQVSANRMALDIHVANNGTWQLAGSEERVELIGTNTTLVGGVISPRSEMLATYALCGFSDLVALGMMSAALSTVAPSRRHHILQVAPRALISGVMASLLTAAMAGLVAEEY